MRRFGLIGRKLSHSFSLDIHNMIGGYEYKLYPLEPEELKSFVQKTDLDGFNITIPYKKDVIPLCSELSPRALAVGSVNTMLRLKNGGWRGENTDYYGFLHLLGQDKAEFQGEKALVLGSGGSSQTVCSVLKDFKISSVVISRNGENNYDNLYLHSDAALIVNTTPVGMYPDNGKSPVELRAFPRCRLVLDLIYNPSRTALLLEAEALGIPSRNGLSMLAAQGVKAGSLFLGKELPAQMADEIAAAIKNQTQNITLIGMPGCGKTTVAKYLSELTGRKMADTDRLIEEKVKMTIPEIFSKKGERWFRALETEVLRQVSKESGQIIATGGGIVTVPENKALIRQNGICIFIDTDKEKLDIAGRPLSQSVGIDRLFKERLPLYRGWSDITYNDKNLTVLAKKIRKDLLI